MCRQLANTVLPILPDAGGCTDPDRLIPDTESSLVRHVADVLRTPYPKQVTSVLVRHVVFFGHHMSNVK